MDATRFSKSERMATKPRPSPKAGAARADGRLIAIRARDDKGTLVQEFVPSTLGSVIVRMAREWGYILRVRTRWAGDSDMRDHFGEKALKDFAGLGIKIDARFASAKQIEVEFYDPSSTTVDGAGLLDTASEVPWEYLLSSATRSIGRFESLLVTRCFPHRTTEPAIKMTKPRNVLFVESAPGRISQEYEFDDEETRLSAALNLKEGRGLVFSKTEPFSKLKDTVGKKAWDVIHVTGVDTHQAAWLFEDFYATVARSADVIDESDRLHDGMILRGDRDSELPVRYDELADLLLESKKPPNVVSLNLYYSGSRTARELVKRGAHAALGFLDEINDEFAELFFQAFYWDWCRGNESITNAFLKAWETMDGDRIHGTSIVIWFDRSMIEQNDTPAPQSSSAKQVRRGGR